MDILDYLSPFRFKKTYVEKAVVVEYSWLEILMLFLFLGSDLKISSREKTTLQDIVTCGRVSLMERTT
jgi:hypothetical protein